MEYLLKNLQSGKKYAIQIRSTSGSGASEWSPAFEVNAIGDASTPKAITNLAGSVNGSSFVLSWTKPTKNTDNTPFLDFAAYQVKITDGVTTAFRTATANSFTYTYEMNLEDFTDPQYDLIFSVASVDASGNLAAYSNTVNLVNPVPTAPTQLRASTFDGGVNVQWKASTEKDFAYYEVYSDTSSASFTPDTTDFTNREYDGVNNFAALDLASGVVYIKICTVDLFGRRSTFASLTTYSGSTTGDYQSPFSQAILNVSPSHYWKLNEQSGTTAIDYGVNDATGTYTNGPTINSTPLTTGSSDRSTDFDGTDDYVVAQSNLMRLATTQWSIGAVVKLDSTSDQVIMTHLQGTAIPYYLGIGLNGTAGKFVTGFYDGSSWHTVSSAISAVAGSTYFIVGVWTGTGLRIYVNGVLDGSSTPSGSPVAADAGTTSLYIGRRYNGGTAVYFNGKISDAFATKTAYNGTIISDLWDSLSEAPGGGSGSALVVKDEGSTLTTGASEINFVGDGVTATNSGGVVTVTIPGGGGSGGSGFAATIGNGTATSFTITHGLGTRDVHVTIYEAASPYEEVNATVEHTGTNSVTVTFSSAPSTNQYRVVVGLGTGGSSGGGGATGIDDLTTFNGVFGSSPTTYDYEFGGSGTSLPSGWSWVNQGDSTYEESLGMGSVFCAYTGGTTTGSANERHRMIVRNIPSESTWNYIAAIPQAVARVGSWHRIGLVLRNSSTGAYWAFNRAMEGAEQFAKIQVNSWSSINTYGGSQPIDRVYTAIPFYFRLKRNSSTSYDFFISANGKSWFPVISAHDPSSISADQIGIIFASNDSQGLYADIDWVRVR